MASWTCIAKSNVKGYSFFKKDNGNYMLQVIWYNTCNECNAMDITEHRSPYYELTEKEMKDLGVLK